MNASHMTQTRSLVELLLVPVLLVIRPTPHVLATHGEVLSRRGSAALKNLWSRRAGRGVVFLVVCLVASLTSTASAWAASGDLDSSFDSDGRVLTDVGGHDSAEGVAIQADGKIVVGGFAQRTTTPFTYDTLLVRYNADGSLDPTFGDSGKTLVDLSGSGRNDRILDLALEPDGDIVVVGMVEVSSSTQKFLVARFDPSGSLDTSFGNGGMVDPTLIGEGQVARGVALQSDGKIVVVGRSALYRMAVARFTSNGLLDDNFGTDGQMTLQFASDASDDAEDVAIDAQGDIVVVGHFYKNNTNMTDMAVARLDPQGMLDPSFDGDGKASFDFSTYEAGQIYDYSDDFVRAVELQDDGGIVLAGETEASDPESTEDAGRDFAAVRLTATGALDTTFSGDGLARTAFSSSSSDYDFAFALAIQPNDKIVLGGSADQATDDVGLVRYMPDGTLDATFGTDGKIVTDSESENAATGGADSANDLALQDDGRIVVVGSGYTNSGKLAVSRYLGDPTHRLAVSLDGTGSGTVSSDPAGIRCGSDCSEVYAEGTTVVLTAQATAGSEFTGWGGACSGTSDSCTVTMDAARSATATFAELPDPVLNVTVEGPGGITSSPMGIDCGLDCSEVFSPGTEVSLTATPDAGSTFTGWSGACSGTSACTVSMTTDQTVGATFVSDGRTLTVDTSGSGTVTSTPGGIACGSDCTEEYAPDTTVLLEPTPAGGWLFHSWSGDCSGSSTACTVSMDTARSVTALFVSQSTPSSDGGSAPATPEEDAAERRAAGDTCEEIADYLYQHHELEAEQLAAALDSVACSPTEIAQAMRRLFDTSSHSAAGILAGLGHGAQAVAGALKAVYGLDCTELSDALRAGFGSSAEEMSVLLASSGCDITSVARALAETYELDLAQNAAVLLGAGLGSAYEVASALRVVYPTVASEEMTRVLASLNVGPEAMGRVLNKLFRESARTTAGLLYGYVTQDAAVLAKVLRNQYGQNLADIGSILKGLNFDSSGVVGGLKELPRTTAEEIARALAGGVFPVEDVAEGLRAVFGFGADKVASVLHKVGVGVKAIARTLKKVFGAGAAKVAGILKGLKIASANAAMALKRVFGLAKTKIAAAMKNAGYRLSEIAKGFVSAFESGWNALVDVFVALGVSLQKIFKILKQIFG